MNVTDPIERDYQILLRAHSMTLARAQSQNIAFATLHDEVVVLRAEVERQQGWIQELHKELRLDLDAQVNMETALEQANDCIERQLSDLETLRAAHDGTSIDWRTR